MAGPKNASKPSWKSVASDGQRSLLHFYKKKTKPANDAANLAEAVNTETVPLHSKEGFEPPTVPQEYRLPSSSLSTDREMKEHPALDVRPLNSSILPQMDAVPSELIAEVSSPKSELSQQRLLQPLGSDDPQESIVKVGPSSPSRRGGKNPKSLPKEPFPIFNRRSQPSSPQFLTGKPGRPAISRASPPAASLLESRQRPGSNAAKTRSSLRDVIDLTEPPRHQGESSGAIVVIEPEPRGSQDAPIELSSSPPPPQRTPKNVVHPFFARRASKQKEDDKLGKPRAPRSAQMQTPWPDAETQHTRGPQGSFRPSAPSPFPSNQGPPHHANFSSRENLEFLKNQQKCSISESRPYVPKANVPTPLEREEIISGMPNSHREHSAISRLLDVEPDRLRATDNREVWSHKWRPRNATHILGNEENIRYMREWLHSLEIRTEQATEESDAHNKSAAPVRARGRKRPVIVRAVEKRRGRKRRRVDSDDGSSLGDWIVDEDEEEDAPVTEYDSEDEFLNNWSSPYKGRISESASNLRLVDEKDNARKYNDNDGRGPGELSQLTNTILLAGPCGSGKTSAVYACAEELGWEVFEVYPGIGRRSGANLSSLVGDVGKNHLVGRREASGSNAKSASIQVDFNPMEPSSLFIGSNQRSFISSGFGFLADEGHKSDAGSDDGSRAVRQSIILLEEVDILFKDDVSFWPAVVNIIKSSHRPVFMTCNDVSLVPQHDLPLQATLLFQACPAPLAVSFLQAALLAEGKIVSRQHLDVMYGRTYEPIGPDEPDEPQVPFPSQAPACSDLRRVLNELQFWYQGAEIATDDGNATVKMQSEISLITAGASGEVVADWSRPLGPDGKTPEEEMILERNDMLLLWKHSEYASYVDGYLERRSSDVMEALAPDRYEPSAEDEIGPTQVAKPRVVGRTTSLAFYNEDEEIARETLVGSRHVFERSGAGARVRTGLLGCERGIATLECRSLVRGRAGNQKQVASYLDDVIPLSAPLLPRAAAIVDYAAYIRQMVSADDSVAAAAAAAAAAGPGASTRPRRRRWTWEAERHLGLSEAGLACARATTIC